MMWGGGRVAFQTWSSGLMHATPGSVSWSQWLRQTFFQLIASTVSEKFALR